MWRVQGNNMSAFKSCALRIERTSRSNAKQVQWQQHDTKCVRKLVAFFSSESSLRSHVQHQDEEAPTLRRFNQGDEAMKITRVGMYVNMAMATAKGFVGMATHSSALIADAAHSLSDLFSDVVTLWSVRIARLPPDRKHPYGA
ncbi:hypothetical protein PsorP6_016500 [Peronosclerospora sorghi]|uniref:Uncharacterized protein n=1 Tax=Peronosclerospora sorghi TaxID=230839 RepID=A0ACC0VQ62_9STRA|nr:hypothetical protein PsorP6_016500 [Peronosclerospora sorghi]